MSEPRANQFQLGWIYPLHDPDRYWDEDDADTYDIAPDRKFSNVLVHGDAYVGDCYIVDAWVVDDAGNQHPGYDQSPVPIRKEDVDLARGHQFTGHMPERGAFGWR